jgi:hypothetical protein
MALGIGERVSVPSKVGIERRTVLVVPVHVTTRGVGLPDFHESMWHRPGVFDEHASADNNALPPRRLSMLASEVASFGVDEVLGDDRTSYFGKCLP